MGHICFRIDRAQRRNSTLSSASIRTRNWMMQRIEPTSLCNRSVCVFVQLSVARSYEDLASVRSIDRAEARHRTFYPSARLVTPAARSKSVALRHGYLLITLASKSLLSIAAVPKVYMSLLSIDPNPVGCLPNVARMSIYHEHTHAIFLGVALHLKAQYAISQRERPNNLRGQSDFQECCSSHHCFGVEL